MVSRSFRPTDVSYMATPDVFKKTVKVYPHSVIDVIMGVSAITGVTVEEMKMQSRVKERVFARQLVCYICQRIIQPKHSTAKIGSHFSKDHSNVVTSYQVIENYIHTNDKSKLPFINQAVNMFKTKSNDHAN